MQTKQGLGPNQKKWIAALRSGRYEQGRGVLRNADDCFCCLGVACDVLDPDGWGDRDSYGDYSHSGVVVACAPSHVVAELRLRSSIGSPADPDHFSLAYLNDGLHADFAQIADTLESDPSMYFKEPA